MTDPAPLVPARVTGRALLRRPDLRRWYLSRAVSYAGTLAGAVTLPLLAYQSSGSAAVTAAVAALEALPYLLFGLVAGAVADRWPRKRLMVGADLAGAVLLASVPAAAAAGDLTTAHLLIAAFGVGTVFCWFDAAAWGALTRVAGRDGIPAANALLWSTSTVLALVVPAAVGVALTAVDATVVVAVDAGTYLLSATLLYGLRTRLDADRPARAASMRADIMAGLAYLWHQPVIRAVSVAGFGLSTAGGGLLGLLVVHADRRLHVPGDDPRLGLLYTASAAGAVAATLLLARMTRRLGVGPLSVAMYVALAAAATGLAVTTAYPAALLLWVAWSLAHTAAITNGITLRQQLTPDDLQGRVNTTGRMIAWGGTPFGATLGGVLAEHASITTAYLVLAVPAVAGAAVLLRSPVGRLRSVEKADLNRHERGDR